MAKGTKLSRDDAYEDIAMTFQRVMVMEVDEALKAAGVKDVKVRRKVCENFSFGMGNFFDQYWFEVEGTKYYPLLCFSEVFLNTDTDVKKLGTVYAKSESFAFHEYAGGDVDAHFGNAKNAGELRVGLVGDDEPTDPG